MSVCLFLFKQKTAYEMRISDWSSDVCSSDLDAWSLTGRVNIPLAEGIAMKLSGSRNKRDGFIHNIVDDSYGDTVDTWTWRGQLRIDATPNLQFLISGDGLIGRENGSLGNVLTNSTGKIGRAHV